ncbi:MAG TPA: 3-deoxy-7-phosphoheptulonate synthase [Halanaerobiaceae bacterium]|nr:3-deoxy-7-phosphoheptulonate synthase [Bacillota bacterium]HHU93032.1 3-deoxy-7-phosphoheptulonate synthase [Halanaerobiaceae bacterium]HOA40223.1 3-deoxy-7-phosphoheptulonate synthase [Halanaerobiales bacterium]HPZ62376.1 3-deoxy-7-phosphoheptulonate synthase [Halanaerobiales bacterium]HQD03774.1 3-deoxy-7-phosphoheptulonate synthase [Halanaerobiales bacterium]
MIIVMRDDATQEEIKQVMSRVEELGFTTHPSRGAKKMIIGIIGDLNREELIESLGAYPGIDKLVPILDPYKLAGRTFSEDPTVIEIKEGLSIGDKKIMIMAGPCAVENEEQVRVTAEKIKEYGATVLRGGAFKPRTSPYSFQGLEEEGLKILRRVGNETGLAVITEVVDPRDVELVGNYTDIFQIGARNMQNFFLLKEVGKTRKPVLLKRGLSATYNEFLMAAEYIMSEGNYNVILCERGIRTFENYTRNTLDLVSIPVLKKLSHLPVVIDPSHGTGHWDLVAPAAKGAVAMGADGLIIEVHPEPTKAMSDGQQSLKFEKFASLVEELKKIAAAVDREL